MRTIKDSCLERMVLIGEGSRRRAVREFVAHFVLWWNESWGFSLRRSMTIGEHMAGSPLGARPTDHPRACGELSIPISASSA